MFGRTFFLSLGGKPLCAGQPFDSWICIGLDGSCLWMLTDVWKERNRLCVTGSHPSTVQRSIINISRSASNHCSRREKKKSIYRNYIIGACVCWNGKCNDFRTCSTIGKVFLLMRAKKGKTPAERYKEYFEDVVSLRLRFFRRTTYSNILDRIFCCRINFFNPR